MSSPSESSPLLSLITRPKRDPDEGNASETLYSSITDLSKRVWTHVGSIGMLGSISIAVNFLTGPAMLEIPAVFQKSGLIPTVLTIVVVCCLAALCSLHMAQAISKLPGNSKFEQHVEYSDSFQRYYSPNNDKDRRWFIATQVAFFVCVTCLNISSLVDAAQVFDTILANFGGSRALQITSTGFYWVSWEYSICSKQTLLDGKCIPFSEPGDGDDDGVIFTAGYLLNILCFMPLALMNLKDNAVWQVVEFIVLMVTTGMFSYLFLSNGIQWEGRLSLWGESWDGLMGVVLFNFALVISIPAWLYEKEPQVDVRKVVTGSSILAALLYILLGTLGAMSMPHVSENMLETFMSGVLGTSMQVTASIFALFIVGLGIPLLSVLCRLNLTGSGSLSKSTGNLLAVYFPFGISWLLYRGDLVTQLLSWGGIIFTSLIAFVFPLMLAMKAIAQTDEEGAIEVYGSWWKNLNKRGEERVLLILLGVSIVSIGVAIIGNLMVR